MLNGKDMWIPNPGATGSNPARITNNIMPLAPFKLRAFLLRCLVASTLQADLTNANQAFFYPAFILPSPNVPQKSLPSRWSLSVALFQPIQIWISCHPFPIHADGYLISKVYI